MTTFIDGPAAGKTLMLHRAPHYLRAVRGPAGDWDALDQLNDTPSAEETIVAYEMVGEPTMCHIKRDRRHGGSGFFRGGRYRVCATQPTDEQMRDTTTWRAWCSLQIGKPIQPDGTVQEHVK